MDIVLLFSGASTCLYFENDMARLGSRSTYPMFDCGRNDAPDHIKLDPLNGVVRAELVGSGPKCVNDNWTSWRGRAVVQAGMAAARGKVPALGFILSEQASVATRSLRPEVVTIRWIQLITNVRFRLKKRASDTRVIIRTKAKYFAKPT